MREPSWAQVLTTSKAGEQWALRASFTQPNWRDDFRTLHHLPKDTPIADGEKDVLLPYAAAMDQCIAEAEKPYALRHDLPPPPGQVAASLLTSLRLKKSGNNIARHQAMERLLLLACALRAYWQEHRSYPDTLQALVLYYLPTIPDDPYAAAGGFHYQRMGDAYVLYSVGPDGKDDGGMPIPGVIDAASTGDILAGVNNQ